MPEVFIDGESIQFSGPAPVSLPNLLEVIEPVMARAGRVLAGITIDGIDPGADVSPEAYGAAQRIDIASVTVAEALAHVAAGCIDAAARLHVDADGLANEVLRSGWSEVAPAIVAFSESLGRLLQDLGTLVSHGSMERVVGDLAKLLNRWMDTIATRDAAAICLCLDQQIMPMLAQVEFGAKALALESNR